MNPGKWILSALVACLVPAAPAAERIHIEWKDRMLSLSGGPLRAPVSIWYLEAYCRPGSTDREWDETVIRHRTQVLDSAEPGVIRLRDTLEDGVIVEHTITAGADEVTFVVEARNPTPRASAAHWAQPCMRVDRFSGSPRDDFQSLVPEYARRCFIFLGERLARLPTEPWAEKARYTPGQVWSGPGVDRDDVNPRPLSGLTPSNGLIGCFSADESQVIAMAWEPWQELFQGVIGCIHSDFRIGGLEPGESKTVRGKVYVVAADIRALLARYHRDFGSGTGADAP